MRKKTPCFYGRGQITPARDAAIIFRMTFDRISGNAVFSDASEMPVPKDHHGVQ